MKRVIAITTLFVLVASLFATDLQQPNKTAQELENFKTRIVETGLRNAPTVSFSTDPVTITDSYYDYMPGGYNTSPLRAQQEFAAPNNTPAGGQYAVFMYQENASSQRRVYWAYIDANGDISYNAIGTENVRQGFPSVAVDPVTGNPFASWHSNIDGDTELECPFSYDTFNILGQAGLWQTPYALIDNPMAEAGQFADQGEFIWPVVNIGPSPVEGKRRIHIYANFAPASGTAEYNSIYGYSDVSFNSSSYQMEFSEWTFKTFPEWDQWQIDQSRRAIKEIAVSPIDGKVVFVGMGGQHMFAMYSEDFGENFEYREFEHKFALTNPLNQDGTPYFTNDDGSAAEIWMVPNSDGGHFNAQFTNNGRYIVYMSTMGVNTTEGMANSTYLPATFYPKVFIYDTQENTYKFVDLQVTGADANDDQPMIPWDLNEDGAVDEYYEDGTVYFTDVWPTYFFAGEAQDGAFHESLFKITVEQNWAVIVFQDGRKLRQAHYENPDYADWAETPEIAISVSSDYGLTWSDCAYMNANANDENYHAGLDGMTPVYVYAGDTITPVEGTTHGLLPIMFYDDNSYGSFSGSNNAGAQNGGAMMYAVIDVDFGAPLIPSSADETNVFAPVNNIRNYPNPFNPNTTISYNLKAAGDVKVEVFNSKGQKVNTLVNGFHAQGEQKAEWNGTDVNGKSVSSGIYFYKVTANNSATTSKMVLMK